MPELKIPRLKKLGHVGGMVAYLVDGEYVRNKIDLDFTCGGNEAVYPNYVPKNEIWIDDALSALDRTATLLHEIVERNLMVNKGWTYDRAHDAASAAERPFRKELQAKRPKSIDLPIVEAQLAKVDRAAADPNLRKDRIKAKAQATAAQVAAVIPTATRVGRKIARKIASAPVKVPGHEREYPRVAAVGRKRTDAQLDRDVTEFLKGSTPARRGGRPSP